MSALEDILKRERPRSLAYIEIGQPFTYLDMVNKEYFAGIFKMWGEKGVYNFSLDSYSYWKRNGILHAKHESLLSTLRMMYQVSKKYCYETAKNEEEE